MNFTSFWSSRKWNISSLHPEVPLSAICAIVFDRTKLEKSDTPEYREKEKIAAQKADEIIKVKMRYIMNNIWHLHSSSVDESQSNV